jgi:hypothetical protein
MTAPFQGSRHEHLLPYIFNGQNFQMKKPKSKNPKARRAKVPPPQIFVLTVEESPPRYARASIRIKAGQYCYLMWRDGKRVRNFYLGKHRDS